MRLTPPITLSVFRDKIDRYTIELLTIVYLSISVCVCVCVGWVGGSSSYPPSPALNFVPGDSCIMSFQSRTDGMHTVVCCVVIPEEDEINVPDNTQCF